MIAIRVHFDGKVLIPEEPLHLPRDQTFLAHLEATPQTSLPARPTALEWMAEQAVDDPALPSDLAQQHDHYLYGIPKQES